MWYFDGPLVDGTAAFDVQPGALKIRRTVLDPDGAPGDREETSLAIPDFKSATLLLTSPAVYRARNGLELRQLHSAPDTTPYAGRDFERTDHLVVRFSLVGGASDGATITANLLSRRGVTLAALPYAPMTGRKDFYEIDMPVGSIARGDYLIAIDASHGADHTRALVSFRVL